MHKVAFLTLEDRADYVIDDELAVAELIARGIDTTEVAWTQTGADWSQYALVIVRTTWDYHLQPQNFLRVLGEIDRSGTRLENPLQLIAWNLDKRYLRELDERGVPSVPSVWGHGGDTAVFRGLFTSLRESEIVIKPTISGAARDTFRLHAPLSDDTVQHLTDTFAGRDWFAQAFVRAVVTEGEFSVFYFLGTFSHAIRKVPKAGDFRVQEEHGGEIIPIDAPDDVRRVADQVLSAITPAPLQARIDLVRLDSGELVVMEVELIEPSLYLRTHPRAAANFADAIVAVLAKR